MITNRTIKEDQQIENELVSYYESLKIERQQKIKEIEILKRETDLLFKMINTFEKTLDSVGANY